MTEVNPSNKVHSFTRAPNSSMPLGTDVSNSESKKLIDALNERLDNTTSLHQKKD